MHGINSVAITLGYVLSVLVALAIFAIGVRFLLAPYSAAKGFGVPVVPNAAWNAYLYAKGARDVASGLLSGIVVASGHTHLLAGFLLAATVIPLVDMLTVLRAGGSMPFSVSVHA